MGRQLEFTGESAKTWKLNVQDVKVTCLLDGLIKCPPDKKAFWTCSQVSYTSETHRAHAFVI